MISAAVAGTTFRPTASYTTLRDVTQSVGLSDLGRREDALAAIKEAVDVYRELARARPDAFLPDLAVSLNNQSVGLSDLGRREDALAAIKEAVAIRRELARARPDAFLPDLAMSLNNQSNRLSDLGRREDALAAIEEAIQLVLPMLERGSYGLPDSGLRLVESYLKLCEQAEREPDEEVLERMYAVLVAAGVLPPEGQE
jgi:tetratricopeptide (TPR) repeat protein